MCTKRLTAAVIFFLCLLSSNSVQAQALSGNVRDELGEPIPGVQITLTGTRIGTTTDAEGDFSISNLDRKSYEVSFRFIGFRTARYTADLSSGDIELSITLVESAIEIGEVLVTADGSRQVSLTRATLSVSSLDPADLTDIRGQSLGETLSHLPGITTLTTGPSISKPVIRGLHSDRLVILNAGVRQEGQQWGGEHAPEIDPFSPDRIEVVRGAAGVEYGVGAIGGVVRVEPRELPDAPGFGGQALLNGFSNSRQVSGSLHLEGAPKQVDGLGWRVQGSSRVAGDARSPDYVLGNTAFRELNGSAAVGFHKDDIGGELYASQFNTDLGIYSGSHINTIDGLLAAIEQGEPSVEYEFGYGVDLPKQKVSHTVAAFKGHWKPRESSGTLEVQYGLQQNARKEFDVHGTGDGTNDRAAFDLTLISQTIDVKYQPRVRNHSFFVFGASGMTQGNENGALGLLIPNFRALTGGAWGRGVWQKNRVSLEAGSRFDYRRFRAFPRANGNSGAFESVTNNYSNISAVVGGIWQFHDSWSASVNLGRAWRPPNMSELFSYGLHHGTAQFEIGDRDLDLEQSLNTDLTIRHQSGVANIEVSGYVNLMDNYIHAFPTGEPTVTIRGVFPTFIYQQTDARLAGMDGLIELSLGRYFSAGVSGSILRARDISNETALISMPADRIHVHTSVNLPSLGPLSSLAFELGTLHVARQSRYPEGVDYSEPPAGYTIVEADIRATIPVASTHIDVSVSVNNVLNASYRDYLSRYRYFVDEIGRTAIVRLRIPFGTYVSS